MRKLLVMAAILGAALPAAAQDIEVPVLVIDRPATEEDPGAGDAALDLVNLVQSAAKGVTTVQEAPAIITILTAEELADRNTRNLEEAVDRVPGWIRFSPENNQFAALGPRGVFQAMLLLRDGVSMFDSMVNIATISRVQPIETIKRVEVITGPGGVLWGANSFLGVMNVITKDAEDVNGVEVSVGYGDGRGDEDVLRGYVMAGAPRLLKGRLKLFAHASFETYRGPQYTTTPHMFSSPTPAPISPDFYGPYTRSDTRRSMIFNFDGKLTFDDDLTLYWSVPVVERYFPLTFPGGVVREDLPEDQSCTPLDPDDPAAGSGEDMCLDRGRAWRRDGIHFFERYAILEWRKRLGASAGITTKAYAIQFHREFDPIAVLHPIPNVLEGGLAFHADFTNYRVGGNVDGDATFGDVRLLYGAEAFHEWFPSNVVGSTQGAGIESTFQAPYDLSLLPLPCPRTARWDESLGRVVDSRLVEDCPLTFAFETDRTVFGAYATLGWRPTKKLILDGGVRAQVAPASLGKRSYDPVLLGQASVVYEFIPDWHAKLNFTQGFRAPVFNNTDSNANGVQFAGRPDLGVEQSTAVQSEVNARLLKGTKGIRELAMRADYSYTHLENFINIAGGTYINGKPRGIHSAELLAKLYLKGDHRVELGYTWLQASFADRGAFKAMPEHWFNLGAVVSLIPGTLEASGTLRVLGAFEDPNLRVEARDLMYDENGHASISDPSQTVRVYPTEMVLDRIAPAAELQLGLRLRTMKDRLTVTASTYNTLDAEFYQPDVFQDYEPRNEYLPNPYEAFRFYLTMTYTQ
jgi:outer membrane receptor protein involved in Fe transport